MKPHIVYIFADDMGYGDLHANNPQSKIPTPNLDRLAAQGMRCTDAHAGTAVCTPSRYALLTGRYCWRSRLKNGIVWEYDEALLEEGRPTVASFLREHGYRTSAIGKWHLGLDWPTTDGSKPEDFGVVYGQGCRQERAAFAERVDFKGRIGGGPVDRGFDRYFGVDVPNFPPYTWFEDDRLAGQITTEKPFGMYGHPGHAQEDWSLEAMIPAFVERAKQEIAQAGKSDQPLFLYLPLTSPHSPIVPNERFKGMSQAGPYGDFVCEVDWVVGEVMAALDGAGMTDDTLVIFSSDNGPERTMADDIGVYHRIQQFDHYSMGELRGIKRDNWEGGHRVPFVARKPGLIPPGTVCDQTMMLGDLFATCADLLGVPVPKDSAEDSVSCLPQLRGESVASRRCTVHQDMSGHFALRQGDWVFIDHKTGDNNGEPEWFMAQRGYRYHDQPGELYNLVDDPQQRRNRYAEEPDRVADMRELLTKALDGAPVQPVIGPDPA